MTPEASRPARRRPNRSAVLAAAALVLCTALPGAAQGIWPERAENLQVLPADFPPDRLRAVMRGFSMTLGVRCSHCHVGEEGQPLSSYDFVSDANPNKDRARAMYQMLGDINDHLAAIEPSGPERVNMWCGTCHAGKPRPMTLAETLSETAAATGGQAVVDRFIALREAFYGGNQYDFRAPNVDEVATALLQRGDTVAAEGLLALNVQHYPDFAIGFESLGSLAWARGDRDAAVRFLERALELASDTPFLRQRIEATLREIREGESGLHR